MNVVLMYCWMNLMCDVLPVEVGGCSLSHKGASSCDGAKFPQKLIVFVLTNTIAILILRSEFKA